MSTATEALNKAINALPQSQLRTLAEAIVVANEEKTQKLETEITELKSKFTELEPGGKTETEAEAAAEPKAETETKSTSARKKTTAAKS